MLFPPEGEVHYIYLAEAFNQSDSQKHALSRVDTVPGLARITCKCISIVEYAALLQVLHLETIRELMFYVMEQV